MKRGFAIVMATLLVMPAPAKGGGGGRSSHTSSHSSSHSSTATSHSHRASSTLHGQTHVAGYVRSNGVVVSSHMRSQADGIFSNNWSTRGNVNPYTGKIGTKDMLVTANPGRVPTVASSRLAATTSALPAMGAVPVSTTLTSSGEPAGNPVAADLPDKALWNADDASSWRCMPGYFRVDAQCIEPEALQEKQLLAYGELAGNFYAYHAIHAVAIPAACRSLGVDVSRYQSAFVATHRKHRNAVELSLSLLETDAASVAREFEVIARKNAAEHLGQLAVTLEQSPRETCRFVRAFPSVLVSQTRVERISPQLTTALMGRRDL